MNLIVSLIYFLVFAAFFTLGVVYDRHQIYNDLYLSGKMSLQVGSGETLEYHRYECKEINENTTKN